MSDHKLHKWVLRILKQCDQAPQAPGFSAADSKREKIFVWYDYLSCPQLHHDIELDEFGIQRGRFLESMNCKEDAMLCVEWLHIVDIDASETNMTGRAREL